MACCKCRRNGSCTACACARSGRKCVDCVPRTTLTCRNSGNEGDSLPGTPHDGDHLNLSDPSSSITPDPVQDGVTHVRINPSFRWGDIPGNTFCRSIDSAYEEVVHWKRNLYLLPCGKVGKAFLDELAKLLNSYASQSRPPS